MCSSPDCAEKITCKINRAYCLEPDGSWTVRSVFAHKNFPKTAWNIMKTPGDIWRKISEITWDLDIMQLFRYMRLRIDRFGYGRVYCLTSGICLRFIMCTTMAISVISRLPWSSKSIFITEQILLYRYFMEL